MRLDAQSGTVSWTKTFGTEYHEAGLGIAVDGMGAAYLAGVTSGQLWPLDGDLNDGTRFDAFVVKVMADDGEQIWETQLTLSSSHLTLNDLACNPKNNRVYYTARVNSNYVYTSGLY